MDLAKFRFIGQGTGETTMTVTETREPSSAHPYAALSLLQVAQGSHVINLHLAGTYTPANFAVASDGARGTLVTFVPEPFPNASLPGHG